MLSTGNSYIKNSYYSLQVPRRRNGGKGDIPSFYFANIENGGRNIFVGLAHQPHLKCTLWLLNFGSSIASTLKYFSQSFCWLIYMCVLLRVCLFLCPSACSAVRRLSVNFSHLLLQKFQPILAYRSILVWSKSSKDRKILTNLGDIHIHHAHWRN